MSKQASYVRYEPEMKKPTDTSGYYPKIESLDERNPYLDLFIDVLWWLVAFGIGFIVALAIYWGRMG